MPYSRGLFEQNDDRDRLGLCTEFIGCESCEMGMDDAEVAAVAENGARWTGRRRERRREEPRFPPPLPWLSDGRSKFLKGERRDGRLVLTEVTMDQPKVFSASRKDGRLKLDVIGPEEEETAEEGGGEEWRETEWRSEGYRRCQEVVHGGPIPAWCHHRFVTTA